MMNSAAFIHGVKDIRIGELRAPVENETSAVVEVLSVGICGSDLHYYKDGGIGSAVISAPFVPGHEFSARLSSDIESLKLSKGQLVAIDPALPCHHCEWCFMGHHNLCPNVIFLGAPPHHGALTNQIAVPYSSIIPLPDTLTADQGAMLEPLGVCIHAVDLARPKMFESVTVLGCGPIGLGIIQLLNSHLCEKIIAIDPQPHRQKKALELGATMVGPNRDVLTDATNGLGTNLVIEATNSPDGFRDAVLCTKIGGRIILAGIPDGDAYSTISAAEARRRGLSIKFSRRMGNVYPRAIKLVASRKIDVDVLVTHRFELEQTSDAFVMQADEQDGLIKSLVYPSGM